MVEEKAGASMSGIFAVLFMGCLIPTSLGIPQQQQRPSIPLKNQQVHYPRLLHADIPLYPPVAWSACFGGTVEIEVHVANGMVKQSKIIQVSIAPQGVSPTKKEFTEVESDKLQPYLTSPALENLKSWRFQSEGMADFVVRFIYQIDGQETLIPENPRIEWDLPSIKIIAKPFKPTGS